MARQISIDAAEAFMRKEEFKRSNTEVILYKTEKGLQAELRLHNNPIAIIDEHRTLSITNAGWETVVTKDRLNELPGVSIYQKDYQWYLNDLPWDGEWIEPSKIILRTLNIDEAAA